MITTSRIKWTKQDIITAQPPTSTRTYKAISHGSIINTLSEELDREGFGVTSEYYLSTANRAVVVGHLMLNVSTDSELKFEVGFLNSYNKTKRAVVAGGSQVIVCENGHILGDISYGAFKKKHVGNADVEIVEFIREMVKRAHDCFDVLIKQKNRMKEIEVSRKVRNELIGQLYLEDAIISETQISIIRKEITKSSFDYNTDPNSLWQIYNNVTVGLKSTHPSKWIQNHQSLNRIINEQFQLV